MRDRLELPIEYDPLIQAYRYTQPVNAFPTVNVTEGELLALLVAQRALEQYRGTPFHRQLVIAFENSRAGCATDFIFAGGRVCAPFRSRTRLAKTDLAVFNALSAAVLRQQEVAFAYRKPGDAKQSPRRVRPYHLANRENSWYLIGFDLERAALRTFALPRIAEVDVTKVPFTRPADFSPEKFFASALGVLAARATTAWSSASPRPSPSACASANGTNHRRCANCPAAASNCNCGSAPSWKPSNGSSAGATPPK